MNRDKQKSNGPKALEEWARLATMGYHGVSIKNMTTSWKSGLAFCALIHRYHPELLDYDKLDESDILGNCSLAFEIAESKLGIPALLEPEDMYKIEVPDRLSVLTYVAQYYNVLKNSHRVASSVQVDMDGNTKYFEKIGVKRPGSVLNSDDILESTRNNLPKRPVLLSSSTVCSVCENPVFISERVLVSKKLYHRSCLRCSHCDCVLNPQTADTSPNDLLFCLDTNCQRELRFLNRQGSRGLNFMEKPKDSMHGNGEMKSPGKLKSKEQVVVDSPPSPRVNITNRNLRDSNNRQQSSLDDHRTDDHDLVSGKKQVSTDDKLRKPVEESSESSVEPLEQQKVKDDLERASNESSSKKFLREILEESRDLSTPPPSEELTVKSEEQEKPKEHIVQSHDTSKSEPEDIPSVVDAAVEDQNEFLEDRLNVEMVELPQHDKDKVRSVSFSAIVEVSKIESDSGSDIHLHNHHDMNTTTDKIVDQKDEPVCPPSPEVKPKNALEFLKENIQMMESQKNPFEDDEEEEESTPKDDKDDATIFKPYKESCEDVVENVSRHESGVGDSFECDSKGVSLNLSDDYKSQAADNSIHDADAVSLSISSDSGSLDMKGKGESQDVTRAPSAPVRKPRVPRSSSPSPRPSPSPRKKASTNELWKTKDYYPAELNPFESEDNFTLQPSDILVVKKASSQVKIVPSNPFEDDEDEEQLEVSIPPKSPVNSIKSADSVSTSGSVKTRSRKSRAPLPPTLTQSSVNGVVHSKRPAPKPPVQSQNNNATVTPPISPEKKRIPASPDLLKGLKAKGSTTNKPHRKRRAPPPKRHVTALPEGAIKTELADLEIKEKELERQGINLEENIRRLMANEDENEADHVDDMVIQLWNVVNEKNDILRRQTELDYLRRGHRLEEMQAEVEFQLRMLMETPADQRQEDQEEAEQQLLQDLLKIVDERNEVVDWLDFHRQMDREEDLHVSQSLSSFSSLSRSNTPTPTPQNNLVLPIKSETGPDFKSSPKSKHKDKQHKEDGKGQKKEKFKIGFFSKKRRSSKSKKQEDDKSIDESLKAS